MEKIRIVSSGLNGQTLFSVFNGKQEPVITGKDLSLCAKEIVRIFPDIVEEIHNSFELTCEIPASVKMQGVEPSQQFDLLETILRISKNKKN